MIGLLRRRIEILEAARAADEAGGAAVSWTPVETVWAGLERLASTRDFAGGRRNPLRRLAATIRWRSNVLPGARVRVDGADYEVTSVESGDGKERRLTLVCEEIAP